jgi:hypothetical protein
VGYRAGEVARTWGGGRGGRAFVPVMYKRILDCVGAPRTTNPRQYISDVAAAALGPGRGGQIAC